ncbi:unnamed protein product [Gongylonema pulchrum]|uniref:ERAP1_C domain-containing protein n=1 Tax=Gongylonema pulchrum TaxID=637853 RepID=A0A183DIW9_9BILA|nr:unnamed protein product [Gongylonema pulchrum]
MKEIDVRSRARILGDAFALAEANSIPYDIPLNLTQYLAKESEFLPWTTALSGFGTIVQNFADEPETQYVRDYLRPLIAPLYSRIDWKTLETAYLDDKLFFEKSVI